MSLRFLRRNFIADSYADVLRRIEIWGKGIEAAIAALGGGGGGGPPSGPAGGELTGTYPNPNVASVHSGSAHHGQSHAIAGADHTGTLPHASTSGITADDHHTKAHTHSGDGSGGIAHSATTGQTANDHHNQAHVISGADHTGTLAHGALSGVGINDHHAEVHALFGGDHTGSLDASQHPVIASGDLHPEYTTAAELAAGLAGVTTSITVKQESQSLGTANTLNLHGPVYASVQGGVADINVDVLNSRILAAHITFAQTGDLSCLDPM